jgi:hypothetical protein
LDQLAVMSLETDCQRGRLEQNWVGDARTNRQVLATVAIADRLFRAAGDTDIYQSRNWRLQAHLMRAYFDGYVQARSRFEWQRENAAKETIAVALEAGGECAATATSPALEVLGQPFDDEAAWTWRNRTYALAIALNVSESLCGGCEMGGTRM